ncbi:hypothetical protein [Rhizobium leguminosarum]|uniref:hypothetical protein n=1 Tax=Rhizobium leguminosarum TaxID=384 RepID=UPI001C963DEE|nr:hypothetical protein [Rhizobium leguminosarum]MBY5361950.1 hypothetical protein [Rhizobium leguminosarum]MBY5664980.1 hypothetical protein [Rhizobium leguminosarum]MBY5677536.1 hypothetical protein [Rhizobium leguminosarum]
MPRGLRAAWARLNGSYERLLEELAHEAAACAARDREERQELIDRHLADRRSLEQRKNALDLSKALDEIFLAAVRPDRRQKLILPKDDVPFNRAQLAEKPSLILAHLSHKKVSFRDLDIKRALADFIDDPLVLRFAIDKALASPELVLLENGEFTTRDYRNAEQRLSSPSLTKRAVESPAIMPAM